ncbi:MAG TPA: hypothetical protein VMZ52_06890 [Bryobacteraceae bacterium]|nr:hypothetical protein [Bryobacteraceae bacterium]
MSTAIATASGPHSAPPVPWRDSNTVSPEKLAAYIVSLEKACAEDPRSADLRTCLGMAYAMNYDVYRSMDSLEAAIQMDSRHFFAQFKYAELLYRLRALSRAQEETEKSIDLARNPWEIGMARKQLLEIRRLIREGTQKPAWTKPLKVPTIGLMLFLTVVCVAMLWR